MFTRNDVRYAFYVLVHPLDGFWDLKHEKRGKLSLALFFLLLWFFANIYESIGTSFLFNEQYGTPLDILKEFRSVFLLFFVFTVGNWSVTTLMDGKGHYRDIVLVFGYASLVLTLFRVPLTMLTYVAAQSEIGYIRFLQGLAWVLFLVLLFFGTMMIHEYSLGKALATACLTVVSMAVLIFIFIVFYNIFAQLYAFVLAMFKELRLRM
jgi:yip1 domain